MFKRLNGASYWYILDCRRGFNVSGMEDSYLASQNTNGTAGYDFGYPVSDGFHWTENNADFNGNGDSYMYLAIRDVDGLVGKPAQVGEDCFNVDFGNGVGGNINNPPFSTKGSLGNTPNGWPSEITIDTKWDSGTNNHKHWTSPMFANTANGNYFTSNSQDAWANWAGYDCDTSVGAVPGSARTSDIIGYMWKRGKGAQCVYYKGTGSTNNVKHNMGVAPEFILVKRVTQEAWETYHAYGNNSVTPWLGFFKAGEDWGWQSDGGARFGAQPTATTFTVTNDNGTNNSNYFYVAWCFAPITGISKMGFISGTGALQNIECGFSPRWLLVKRNDSSGDGWFIFDTKRGWGAGSDKWLQWQDLGWGGDIDDGSTPYATGFTLGTSSSWNGSGRNYIYYAHS